ncbi:phosphatidylglycerol lysyltransferase domain-containing protein [Lachnospiraceae bacterium C1.1]|nr:phosphatidylglycerol lysyltransferase domain-containing protein [Lachnospiraceae bacterium C1.1]
MKDSKKYIDIPKETEENLFSLGYSKISADSYRIFDRYYNRMNDWWTSSSAFINLVGLMDSYIVYMKEAEGMMLNMIFLRTDGYFVAGPFLGEYKKEKMPSLMKILSEDFEALSQKFIIMDVAKWMMPFYEASGFSFEVEDDRDIMEYIFTPEQFFAGLNQQDDRYRYNYFNRKNQYETINIRPEHAEEIDAFMNREWCENNKCENCHFGCLKKIIVNVVKDFDKLNARGILVRVDGRAAGICIVTCRNHIGMYHYKNAINRIKGLNEFLLRESFERFMGDAEIINYTEDMGIESLRYYKMHMAPEYGLFSRLTLTVENYG